MISLQPVDQQSAAEPVPQVVAPSNELQPNQQGQLQPMLNQELHTVNSEGLDRPEQQLPSPAEVVGQAVDKVTPTTPTEQAPPPPPTVFYNLPSTFIDMESVYSFQDNSAAAAAASSPVVADSNAVGSNVVAPPPSAPSAPALPVTPNELHHHQAPVPPNPRPQFPRTHFQPNALPGSITQYSASTSSSSPPDYYPFSLSAQKEKMGPGTTTTIMPVAGSPTASAPYPWPMPNLAGEASQQLSTTK